MPSPKVSFHVLRRRACLAAATCALLTAGAAVPSAGAQEPGVVYEPGSPSAKEYAIPLEEARVDAGGAIPGSAETRAFGIGITRRAEARRPGSRAGAAGGARGARRGRGEGRPQRGGGSAAPAPGLRDRLAEAEAAGAPAFWSLGPLLLVLLPGLAVGLLLARRGARPPAAS